MTKLKVLIFCDYYLPGVKAGGPIRSISNLVSALKDDLDFVIVTRDRDFGDDAPYKYSLESIDGVKIYYLSPEQLCFSSVKEILKEISPHLVYLNSFFSWHFSLKIILLKWKGVLKNTPVLLAPRGELSVGALRLKSLKKTIYLRCARLLSFYNKVVWHATSNSEAAGIRKYFSRGVIKIAANLPMIKLVHQKVCSQKQPGVLRLVFLSRISPKKNLLFALEQLSTLKGDVRFDIYGPIEGAAYWKQCQRSIKKSPNNILISHKGLLAHEQVVATLSQYDAFIFPTLGENYGHVILEALAAACPVLLADTTPWLNLGEKHAGWVFSLNQPLTWQQRLQALVYMDEEEHARLRAGARAYAHEVLNDSEILEAAKRLFEA